MQSTTMRTSYQDQYRFLNKFEVFVEGYLKIPPPDRLTKRIRDTLAFLNYNYRWGESIILLHYLILKLFFKILINFLSTI